jgi:hypothetical protein
MAWCEASSALATLRPSPSTAAVCWVHTGTDQVGARAVRVKGAGATQVCTPSQGTARDRAENYMIKAQIKKVARVNPLHCYFDDEVSTP